MRIALTNVFFAGNAFRDRFEHPLSVKSLLLFGALIAIFVGLGVALSVATNKKGEKKAQNLTEFYEDDTLETRKLERTLSIALLAVAVVAVSMALYYLWEPTREAKMTTSFETRSVRRGQTLFANAGMKGYSSTQSLSCANCHGGYNEDTGRYAEGGTANYTLKALKDPETDAACAGDEKFRNADCITVSVAWKAPPLNTVLYKYPIRKAEAGKPFVSSCRLQDQHSTPDCRTQVYDILTYGRPGTPMPAWGVAGGGPKNEQAINDLVNFLASIQLPADEAAQPLRSAAIIMQKKKIAEAKTALDDAKESAIESGTDPAQVDNAETVKAAQQGVDDAKALLKSVEAKTETQYIRDAAIAEAQEQLESAQKMSNIDAPEGLSKAQADYEEAVTTYDKEPTLKAFANPQDYLDKLEKDQTEIKLEKQVEEAKAKGDKKASETADKKHVEVKRLINLARNFLETRDALATAKATSEVFAPASLSNAQARLDQLQSESDGALLFEANCARCHTKGWSYFNPGNARIPLPASQGTGAFGPTLAGGNVTRQFINAADQITFIGNGSAFQAPYGSRGIGTGRMPGFNSVAGRLLTDEQIAAIVDYERNGLLTSSANSLGVTNLGSANAAGRDENNGNSKTTGTANSGIVSDNRRDTDGASNNPTEENETEVGK